MDENVKIIVYNDSERTWKRSTVVTISSPQKGDNNKYYRFVRFNKTDHFFKYHLEKVATYSYNLAQKYNLKNEMIELPNGKIYKCDLIDVYKTISRTIYEISLDNNRIYLEKRRCDIEKIIRDNENNLERVNRLFNYFYKLVSINSNAENNINENKDSFLLSQYDNLKVDKKSVLYDYFTASNKLKKSEVVDEFIFPFPFNLSQKEAIKNALNNGSSSKFMV